MATDHSLWFNERLGNKIGRLGLVNYNRTVSASPPAGGTVSAASGTFLFLALSSQSVTATANPGYRFNNWTMDGNVVSMSANYTFTLAGNFNLVANFSRNSTSHDFNGDGYSDILWRNADGDVAIWLMQNFSLLAAPYLENVATSWSIA